MVSEPTLLQHPCMGVSGFSLLTFSVWYLDSFSCVAIRLFFSLPVSGLQVVIPGAPRLGRTVALSLIELGESKSLPADYL